MRKHPKLFKKVNEKFDKIVRYGYNNRTG